MIERITIASDELVVEIAPLGAALASVRPVEHGAPGPNLVLAPGPAGDGARRIAQAFDAVAALFVDGKPFDSPVAPLSKEK